jgi:hypothetical protein
VSDYRQVVADIRRRRDIRIEAGVPAATARRDASQALAAARAERDEAIRVLRAAGLSWARIGRAVGCSADVVGGVVNPQLRESANARRRRHWHVYSHRKPSRHLTLAA